MPTLHLVTGYTHPTTHQSNKIADFIQCYRINMYHRFGTVSSASADRVLSWPC
jgi:hypothetical protein